MADNSGATNEYRALNYLAVRYQAGFTLLLCLLARLAHGRIGPFALVCGTRNVVEVFFAYTNRNTDVATRMNRVDVTEEFPFLVTQKLCHCIRPRPHRWLP